MVSNTSLTPKGTPAKSPFELAVAISRARARTRSGSNETNVCNLRLMTLNLAQEVLGYVNWIEDCRDARLQQLMWHPDDPAP